MTNLTNEILEGTEEVVFEAAEEIVERDPMAFVKAAGKAGVVVLAVYGGVKLIKDEVIPFAKKVFGKKGQNNEIEAQDTETVKTVVVESDDE